MDAYIVIAEKKSCARNSHYGKLLTVNALPKGPLLFINPHMLNAASTGSKFLLLLGSSAAAGPLT